MKKNILIASIILLSLFFWILSGQFSSDDPTEDQDPSEDKIMSVQVLKLNPINVQETVNLSGKSIPNRRVTLKAEIEGRITAINANRGSTLSQNDLIAQIDERDWRFKFQQAHALLNQRELEYNATQKLNAQNMASDSQLAQSLSALENARAQLELNRISLKNTRISAPFNAKLQDRFVEIGDFVKIGDPIAEVVDSNPLIIHAAASEKQARKLQTNMPGTATISDRQPINGHIRYLAPEAETNTRTFTVELQIPNPNYSLPIGETAKLQILVNTIQAFKISPAHLALDINGNVGVKLVNHNNQVLFTPIQIVKMEKDALYIQGPNPGDQLITVGHGFVKTGQTVTPVTSDEA